MEGALLAGTLFSLLFVMDTHVMLLSLCLLCAVYPSPTAADSSETPDGAER